MLRRSYTHRNLLRDIIHRLAQVEQQKARDRLRIKTLEEQLAIAYGSKQLWSRAADCGSPTLNSPKDTLRQEIARDITAIVGLHEALTWEHRGLRLVWTLALLVGICATVWFVWASGAEYLSKPTATKVDLLAQSSYEYPIIIICPDNWLDLDKALSLGFTLDALTYSFGYLYSNENVFTLENVTTAKEAFFRAYEQNGFSSLDDYYEAITMNVSLTKSIDEFLKDQTAALLCVTCVHEPRKMILDGAVCYYFSLANQDGTRRSLGRHPIAMKLSDKTGGFLQVTPIWKLHAVNNNDLLLKVSAAACVPLETSCWTVVRISVQRFVKGKEGDAACVTKEEKAVRYANSSPDACYMKCISEASGQSGGKCRMHHDTVGKAKSPAKYCNYFESSLSKHVARLSHMHLESNRRNALISPECTRKCPYECDRVIYEASLKDRVKEEYLSAAMQQIGRIIRAQNMSVIGLRLEHEAAYNGGILTVEEMSTLSFTSMVANIGGALGLFVGGTMMTFVQMTLFVVKKLLDRRVRNSQAHPMDSTYSA